MSSHSFLNSSGDGNVLQFWDNGWVDENGASLDDYRRDSPRHAELSNLVSENESRALPYPGVFDEHWSADDVATPSWLPDDISHKDDDANEALEFNSIIELTRDSKKRRTSILKKAKEQKTYHRSTPAWEKKLAADIRASVNPITKLNVAGMYLSHQHSGRDPADGRALESARKWTERFMKRHSFIVRRTAFASKKSARKLWGGVVSNWDVFDNLRKEIERHYRFMSANHPGKALSVTCLNSDETFLRDNLQTSSVIIPIGSFASRTSQVNQRDTHQGQTLHTFLSSDKRFVVEPTLIMHKLRPSKIVKREIALACRSQFPKATIYQNGNERGIAWNTSELFEIDIQKVRKRWATFRNMMEEQGKIAYLIWYSILFFWL